MEFPDLGEQCSLPSCRQLDFLPFKCSACSKIFCQHHHKYSEHDCSEGLMKNKVIPTCPLCNNPVSLGSGDTPDSAVTRHIDNNCDPKAAALRRQQQRANRCGWKGCKNGKDAIRVSCDGCHVSFCISHRHPMDHKCSGLEQVVSRPSKNIFPTFNTQQSKKICRPTAVQVHSLQQPGLSEEEALRRAIKLSMQSSSTAESNREDNEDRAKSSQDESDEALARALQEAEFSQVNPQRTPVTTSNDSNKQSCCIS